MAAVCRHASLADCFVAHRSELLARIPRSIHRRVLPLAGARYVSRTPAQHAWPRLLGLRITAALGGRAAAHLSAFGAGAGVEPGCAHTARLGYAGAARWPLCVYHARSNDPRSIY